MEKFFPPESKVRGLRLINDLELVAEVETLPNGDYELTMPLQTYVVQGETGLVMDLVPFSLIIPRVLPVPKSSVLLPPFKVDGGVENLYMGKLNQLAQQ